MRYTRTNMEYLTRCRANSDICVTGIVIGLVIAIVLYFAWTSMKSESIVVFRTDPVADALLNYQVQSDPIDSSTIRLPPKKEHFDTQDENPILIRKLWR